MATSSNIRAGRAFVEIALDQSKLQKGLQAAQARLKSFGASLTSVGTKMLGLATLAATPFAFATKTFADFDDEMRMTKAVSGAVGQEFQMLTDTAERLGRETSFMAKEVAQGMTAMGRMGFKPKEINEAIASVLNLARATGTDLGQAAEIAANNMRVFGLASAEMASVSDILTATANGSAQTLTDLAEGLKMAGPQAAAAQDDIRNVAGALGVLANMGIKGSLAGTALRKSYSQFANTEVQKKLQGLGIDTLDQEGNLRAMPDIMADIAQEMQKMPTGKRIAFAEDIFDLRGSLAGLQLGGNIEQLRAFIDMLKNVEGTAEATAVEMDKGLGGAFRRFLSAAEGVQIAVGRILGEALAPYIDRVSLILNRLAEWAIAHQEVVVTITKVIAAVAGVGATLVAIGITAKVLAVAIGGLSVAFTLLKTAVLAPVMAIKLVIGAYHLLTAAMALSKTAALATWAVISAPAFLTAAALTAVVAIVGEFSGAWDLCAEAVRRLGREFGTTFTAIGGVIKETAEVIRSAFLAGDLAGAARVGLAALKVVWLTGILPLRKAWLDFRSFLSDSWTIVIFSLLKLGNTLWTGLLAGFRQIGDAIADTWGFLWNGIVNSFASTIAWLQKRWIEFKGFFADDVDVQAEIKQVETRTRQQREERESDFANNVGRRAQGRRDAGQDRESANAVLDQAMAQAMAGNQAKADAALAEAKQEMDAAAVEWRRAITEVRQNAEVKQAEVEVAQEKTSEAAVGTERAARQAGVGGDAAVGSWSLKELGNLLSGGDAEERTASATENSVKLQRETNKFLRRISTQTLSYGG
jgi:TP901 family phage tail tape measure protein